MIHVIKRLNECNILINPYHFDHHGICKEEVNPVFDPYSYKSAMLGCRLQLAAPVCVCVCAFCTCEEKD